MALQDTLDTPLSRAVRKAGSQKAYARIVGRSQPAIHDDLRQGKPVALEEVPAVERALDIPRWELRPDYFEAPASTNTAQDTPEPPPEPVQSEKAFCPNEDTGGSYSGDPLEGMAA